MSSISSPLLRRSQCMIFHSTKRVSDLCEHSCPEHVLLLYLKKTWLRLVFSAPCQFEKNMSTQAWSHFYVFDVILIWPSVGTIHGIVLAPWHKHCFKNSLPPWTRLKTQTLFENPRSPWKRLETQILFENSLRRTLDTFESSNFV